MAIKIFLFLASSALLLMVFKISFLALFSLYCIAMIIRELISMTKVKDDSGFSYFYIGGLSLLSLAFGWLPLTTYSLEKELVRVIYELSGRETDVHCNSIYHQLTDSNYRYAGHINIATGSIVLQPNRCREIRKYIKDPENATLEGIYTLNLITHEAMHARGERDEFKTECQSVQRNYKTARLLGASKETAQSHTTIYYEKIYPKINYFNSNCGPGKSFDEQLPNPPWEEIEAASNPL